MAVFCEKFGWSYEQYMHGGNFMINDMMLVDNPRMLSEKEQEQLKKKKSVVKVNDINDMERQLKNMFG